MASLGGEQVISSKILSDTTPQKENRPSSGEKKSFMEHSNSTTIHWFAQIGEDNNSNEEASASRDREEKLRLIRERQNEERQKKIEELKAQAEAAQKYREQKEEERRRRIEELRSKDSDRRHQVEERKRAIIEAEKERREYILRKNQEREARLDTKRRNEKSSISFAFGSSTPRLLDPSELGNVSPSAFWGHRRSTSITNVAYTGAPLTRRSSERELADGSKKRATSAGGIDRQNEDWRRRSTSMYEVFNWGFVNDEPPKRFPLSIAAAHIDIDGPPTTTTATTIDTTTTSKINKESVKFVTKEETTDSAAISYRSVYRRKTDLMPTIPSPREPSFGSKSSLHSQAHTPRTPGSRSGEVTPKGSNNTSRPGSAMSTSTTTSSFVQRRSTSARKPRPASIAVTGVSLNDEHKQRKEKPPLPKVQNTPKRSNVNHHTQSPKVSSADSNKTSERKSSAIKRDITPHKLMSTSMTQSMEQKVLKNAIIKEKQTIEKNISDNQIEDIKVPITDIPQTKEEKDALNTVKTEINNIVSTTVEKDDVAIVIKKEEQNDIENKVEILENNNTEQVKDQITEKIDDGSEKDVTIIKDEKESVIPDRSRELSVERQDNEMTASMIAKSKITTEEEAKAALAERRRLAREEAERQAELERQRVEEERQAELRRQQEEEERQKKFEEESTRLAEEQRRAEEERLLQAIEEAKKRDLEDKLKKEEDERLKAEKEENEKKAKEEAEKQRLEMAERLKREEKEREERRKRVEAIMSRTRNKGNGGGNSTPVKENENNKQTESVKTVDENVENQNSQDSKENNSKMVNVEKSSIEEEQQQQQQNFQPITQQQQQQQTTYEQSVTEKENALLKSFNNMIIDENAKNIQNVIQNPFLMMNDNITNGKMVQPQLSPQNNQQILNDIPVQQQQQQQYPIANGNGHIENNLNKNETNSLIDVSSTNSTITDQLIDFSNESQQQQQQLVDVVNFTNNNLLTSNTTTTTTLVTADSHENKEISLL